VAFAKLSLILLLVAQAPGVAEDMGWSAWLVAPPLGSVALAGAGRFHYCKLAAATTGSTSSAEEDQLVSDEVWSNGGTRIDVACFFAGSALELTLSLSWQVDNADSSSFFLFFFLVYPFVAHSTIPRR
jgi:hypothetical protein